MSRILVLLVLATPVGAQALPDRLRAGYPGDGLPHLLAALETESVPDEVVNGLRGLGPSAHVYLFGMLRNRPMGRFPRRLNEAFGPGAGEPAGLGPLLAAASACDPPIGPIASAWLGRLGAVAKAPPPRRDAFSRAELLECTAGGDLELAWPVARAAMAAGDEVALEVFVALLARAQGLADGDPARTSLAEILHAMRLEASARALLEPAAWRALPREQRAAQWTLIARSGGARTGDSRALLAALLDESTAVRGKAAIALALREDGGESVAALEACDCGDDVVAGERVALALAIRSRARDVWRRAIVDSCRAAFGSGDEGELRAALGRLHSVGEAAFELAPELLAAGARVAAPLDREVVWVLANCGPQIVPLCVEAVAGGDPRRRAVAGRALASLRPVPAAASAVLLELTRDVDLRDAIAEAFAASPTEELVRGLIAGLGDDARREAASFVLERCVWLEPWRERLVAHSAELVARIPGADAAQRSALFSLLRRDARHAAALATLCASPEAAIRHEALGLIGSFGPAAAASFPQVVRCVDDLDPDVAVVAALALAGLQVEPERAVTALAARLDGAAPARLQVALAAALGSFGPAARPAAARLTSLLGDAGGAIEVRRAAAVALLRLEESAPEAVAFLREQLASTDTSQRVDVLRAIAGAGEAAAVLLDAVRAELDREEPELRDASAFALGAMRRRGAPALASLRKALERCGGSSYRIERAIELIETARD